MEVSGGETRGKHLMKNGKWIKINDYKEQLF